MSAIPAAILFINNDLVDEVRDWIVKQMHISEYMDGYTFDQRLLADPNYKDKIQQLNLRIMVIRPFNDYTNRSVADLAIFVKNGMGHAEINRFGPPGITFPVINMCWAKFGVF